MTNANRRIKQNERYHIGESIGTSLARSLNAKVKPAGEKGWELVQTEEDGPWFRTVTSPKKKERVLEIIALILKLESAAQTHKKPSKDWHAYIYWQKSVPKEVVALTEKLNRMLLPYKYSPFVDLRLSAGRLEWDQQNTGSRTNGESQMIGWAIKLSEIGMLNRVRLCTCGKWFFALRSDSTCCSTKCRQGEYEQKEDRIEKRRENARRYYWLHKNKNVK